MNETEVVFLGKAIAFAAEKHKNQRRKDAQSTPYINHPLNVMNFLMKVSKGSMHVEYLSAAVLHDTIEDTNTTYEEIFNEFGYNVAEIVRGCSDNKSLDKVTRKRQQVDDVLNLSHNGTSFITDGIIFVKLADKYDNCRGLCDINTRPATWSSEEIDGYNYWALYICSILFEKLNSQGLKFPFTPIERTIIKSLETTIFPMFKDNGYIIDDDIKNKLEIYYKHIENSE